MENNTPVVLVVDDYAMNLKLVEFALKAKCTVITAESGADALNILSEKKVDLILLDIMMPGMDGFETYEKLRAIDSCKDTPVCFLTGDTDEGSISKMNELKVPHIEKPFVPAKLIEIVESLLK